MSSPPQTQAPTSPSIPCPTVSVGGVSPRPGVQWGCPCPWRDGKKWEVETSRGTGIDLHGRVYRQKTFYGPHGRKAVRTPCSMTRDVCLYGTRRHPFLRLLPEPPGTGSRRELPCQCRCGAQSLPSLLPSLVFHRSGTEGKMVPFVTGPEDRRGVREITGSQRYRYSTPASHRGKSTTEAQSMTRSQRVVGSVHVE